MRDPYKVLGVPRGASAAEIKKAFRALAKSHHPDARRDDPGAEAKFQEISAAYDLLSDPEKRGRFDRGEIDANGNPTGFGGGGFRPGAGDPFQQTYRPGPGGGPGGGPRGFDPEDILSDLFGSFTGRGRRGAQPERGADVAYSLEIGFVEAATGGTERIALGHTTLDVKIPPGVADGQTIRLRGKGRPGSHGGPDGDALITVKVAPHPLYRREGRDIRIDLPVSLIEAVEGAGVTAPTVHGPVKIKVPAGANTGLTLRLKGKGIAASGSEPAGDQYVRLVVTLPETLDPELKAFIARWGQTHGYDPRAKLQTA